MSPRIPPNCSLSGARVQAPFTLSDTRTCPGEPYWANQPTRRSPAFTGRLSDTGVDAESAPSSNPAPCTNVIAAAARPAVTIAVTAAASRASEANTARVLLGTGRVTPVTDR